MNLLLCAKIIQERQCRDPRTELPKVGGLKWGREDTRNEGEDEDIIFLSIAS